MSAKKNRSSPPCCHCAKRNTRCDGEIRTYPIPNGARYCTSFESEFCKAMGWKSIMGDK